MKKNIAITLYELFDSSENDYLLISPHKLVEKLSAINENWKKENLKLLGRGLENDIIEMLAMMRLDQTIFSQLTQLSSIYAELLDITFEESWWIVQSWAYAFNFTTTPPDNLIDSESPYLEETITIEEIVTTLHETKSILKDNSTTLIDKINNENEKNSVMDKILSSSLEEIDDTSYEPVRYHQVIIPIILIILLILSLQYWPKEQFKKANSETLKKSEKSVIKKVKIKKFKFFKPNHEKETFPVKISLSTNEVTIVDSENFDLNNIFSKLIYKNGKSKIFIPDWKVKSGNGVIENNLVKFNKKEEKIIIETSYKVKNHTLVDSLIINIKRGKNEDKISSIISKKRKVINSKKLLSKTADKKKLRNLRIEKKVIKPEFKKIKLENRILDKKERKISDSINRLKIATKKEEKKENGILILKSKPEGASIIINGKKINDKTNIKINDIPVGSYIIKFILNGIEKVKKVRVNSAELSVASVKFIENKKENSRKLAREEETDSTNRKFGDYSIKVNCDLKDSIIYLNGKIVGKNSLVLKNISPGYYKLMVKRYGEKLLTTFFLRENSRIRVEVKFKRRDIRVITE